MKCWQALLLLAVTTAALAGCGGGSSSNGEASKSPAQILADAKQAAHDAGSVRISGTIHDSGQTIGVDLSLTSAASGGSLTLHGSKVDIVRVGRTVYIRGGAAFYKSVGAGTAGSLLAGKWLKAPTTAQDFSSLAALTQLDAFLTQVLKPSGKISKGGESTVDGQKTIQLKDGQGGSLFVATTGKPYPVELSGSSGRQGELKLTDWGAATAPTAPKHAIDISKLGG
ncbi:MAG TPA: hypothetical protein VFA30_02065 [Gaiellaceae bacterium]|nr:hypothetical protein [Gaiellaceae bacterium]